MKKTLTLICVLCVVAVLAFAGCTSQPTASTAPSATVAPSAEASATVAPSQAAEIAEIYKLNVPPKTCLSGVIGPNLEDRAAIAKAWPKTPKDPKKIVIGWTEITLGNPWFVEMAKAAKAKAAEYGFELNMLVADSSVEKQSSQIDSFITQGVDIIVVDPCDVLGPVNDIKRAVEAGIPVVGMGTVMDSSSPILTTVLLNPFEVGYACGLYAGNKFDVNTQLNTAIILGVMGNSTSESRICGTMAGIITDRLKQANKFTTKEDAMLIAYNLFQEVKTSGKCDYPDLKFSVLGFGDGNWTEEGGLAAAEDILTASGDKLNLIMTCNDFEGLGAVKAVKARNLQATVKVMAAADGAKTGLDAVKAGDMLCTGTFAGPSFGSGTVEFIKQIFIDGKDPSDLPMGTYSAVDCINPENMDKYYDSDPNNAFYKLSPFEFPKSIPEIKASFAK
jgi:ribose transport system substrate-binding protein